MKRWYILVSALAVLVALGGCRRLTDTPPVSYDPAEGGWELYAENDFSSTLTTVRIPILLVEGDASVALEDGRLKYVGDSRPDDQMWLRTDYGFLNTNIDYKIYVEPVGELEDDSQHISFTGWHRTAGSSVTASLRSDELELRADGGSADAVFGEVARGENLDTGRYAFELIIESYNVTARVIDIETSVVTTSVGGTLGSLEYYDGHDLRLRCGYSGTIYLDNYQIYVR